jgi:hypothetical protein
MKTLLWIWQAPQHLVALALWKIFTLLGKVVCVTEMQDKVFICVNILMGLSLGKYIFVCERYSETVWKHEQGHSVQSYLMGPLYLIIVGLPSVTRNIYDRITHKGAAWYYSGWPENDADRRGGVSRS